MERGLVDSIVLSSWSNYFSTIASAGATLTGLLFVAVSINLSRILQTPGLTGRVAESLVQLFGVVAIATTYLIPGLRMQMLGLIVLLMALLAWAFQVYMQVKYLTARTGHSAPLDSNENHPNAGGLCPSFRLWSSPSFRVFCGSLLVCCRIRALSCSGHRKCMGLANRDPSLKCLSQHKRDKGHDVCCRSTEGVEGEMKSVL
jgi:hypothetical protein